MLIVPFLLSASAPATMLPRGRVEPACLTFQTRTVSGEGPTVHPLRDEPPAQAFYPVVRIDDGCLRPTPISAHKRSSTPPTP